VHAFYGADSRFPRALAAARASLVRSEIASRTCSATAARMWMVSLLACGLSTATNSTPTPRGSLRGEISGESNKLRNDQLRALLAVVFSVGCVYDEVGNS
jgi:hypothetical protein